MSALRADTCQVGGIATKVLGSGDCQADLELLSTVDHKVCIALLEVLNEGVVPRMKLHAKAGFYCIMQVPKRARNG